ncbi:hypothetical protein [Corynebacterium timonense]|uniref:DUF4276 family protein n=1 Tax=Corynebacterium timonense TaxID=441500 RepID=A0A1H1VJH2_9CORY|nr:hypothetical protein [Corynebacterium timonense]SDS85027.1 hypothetical protein SAMN04488539_2527 [Corynebacterium timonense]
MTAAARAASVLFVREGSSDDYLLNVIVSVFRGFGIQAAIDSFPFNKRRKNLAKALEDVAAHYPHKTVILVHRDADNAGWNKRIAEIRSAGASLNEGQQVIPVIPVKETEAWILHAMHDDRYLECVGVDRRKISEVLPKKSECSEVNAKDRLQKIHDKVHSHNTRGRAARRRTPTFESSRQSWLTQLDDSAYLAGNKSFEEFTAALAAVFPGAETGAAPKR